MILQFGEKIKMDIKCHKCREPWDMDSLHDLVSEGTYPNFDEAYEAFKQNGCEVFGTSHGELMSPGEQDMYAELAFTLGDDVDGLASMLEDFGL
jgi:hypothetical protein